MTTIIYSLIGGALLCTVGWAGVHHWRNRTRASHGNPFKPRLKPWQARRIVRRA